MNRATLLFATLFMAAPGITGLVLSGPPVTQQPGGEAHSAALDVGTELPEERTGPWETLESTAGFDLSWFTIDSGGGVSSAGAFEVSGTIGQPDAGMMSGGSFELAGGYWAGGAGTPVLSPCVGDINQTGSVDVFDLLLLLEAWGSCPAPCPADLNNSGAVDVFDLLLLLQNWGACPD